MMLFLTTTNCFDPETERISMPCFRSMWSVRRAAQILGSNAIGGGVLGWLTNVMSRSE